VTVGAIDAFGGYANALAAYLPDAMGVMDHFHTIQLANRALDKVRRRVQTDTLGHRGRRGDPLYRIQRLALLGAGRLDANGWDRLEAGLVAGDPARRRPPALVQQMERSIERVYNCVPRTYNS
jgi:hypothetical protein